MEFRYKLSIKDDCKVDLDGNLDSFNADNAEVAWLIEGNHLKGAYIIFSGVPLVIENGIFDPVYPIIHKSAYKIATYIKNRLLSQVGIDAFCSPMSILNSTPEFRFESSEEETTWNNCVKKTYWDTPGSITVVYPFKTEQYAEKYCHSKAYTYYAEAMRISSPFLKYELLYKVIEHFFDESGDTLDEIVSTYAATKNSDFNKELCGRLRQMRNKITHPQARQGHLNPENLEDIYEVQELFVKLKCLAKLLLEFPPR